MESKEVLKMILRADQMVMPLLLDMQDAPLTFPTSNGGCHPLWVLGHMTYGEGNLFWHLMRGEPNPVAEWEELFDMGTEPVGDAEKYPPFDEVLQKHYEIHGEVEQLLESLSEEELDQPSKNVPPEWAKNFGTWRQCFLMGGMHWLSHRGQVCDARRAAGKSPMFA